MMVSLNMSVVELNSSSYVRLCVCCGQSKRLIYELQQVVVEAVNSSIQTSEVERVSLIEVALQSTSVTVHSQKFKD